MTTTEEPTTPPITEDLPSEVDRFLAAYFAMVKAMKDNKNRYLAGVTPWEGLYGDIARLRAALKQHREESQAPRQEELSSAQSNNVHEREIEETHESYGVVQFSRVSGGGHRLFGSTTPATHFFTLVIRRGRRHLSAHDESFMYDHRYQPIVEVQLSAAQFAELITTMNVGCGVPCTITDVMGVRMSPVPRAPAALEHMYEDFRNRTQDFVAKLEGSKAELASVLAKPNLNKADKQQINDLMNKVLMEVKHNMPFVLQTFSEHAEKVVQRGKTEVESFIQLALTKAGIKAIEANGGTLRLTEGIERKEGSK